jgi:hypothetical protein
MSIRIKLFAAALLLTSLSANAVGNFGAVEIAGVYVRESRVDIILAAVHSNPTGCVNTTELVLIIDEYPGTKAMIAAVLAAHLAGRKISGFIASCHDDRGKLVAVNVERRLE